MTSTAAALKHRIRNLEMETESRKWKQKRKWKWNQISVPLHIFLFLCLDKVCRSVDYCAARLMKVILRLILIHESMGWIIQLNIAFVAKCQE